MQETTSVIQYAKLLGLSAFMKNDPNHLDELTRRLGALVSMDGRIRLAVIFGSTASGKANAESDIDIAILPTHADMSLDAELSLQVELTRLAGRSVDLVRLDRAPTLIRWEALRDGVLLFQSGPSELARARAAAASEYIDFAPALEAAAARFRRRLAAGTAPGNIA
jgi:predicted nucleotidyltransferase